MDRTYVSKATLGRLPLYLNYIRSHDLGESISSTRIAKALGLGEVQVRKDLAAVCSKGRPKVGYERGVLIKAIEDALGTRDVTRVILVGAGKLGKALLGYDGFREYGVDIVAGFDSDPGKTGIQPDGKLVYRVDELADFCRDKDIHIGVLTVPGSSAQTAADGMIAAGIDTIWSFSPADISVPDGVLLRKENLALGLAHLVLSARTDR
jgi:redox-sensing transcriptional repressor